MVGIVVIELKQMNFINEFKILQEGEDGYCKPKREKQKDDFSFEYNGDDLPF